MADTLGTSGSFHSAGDLPKENGRLRFTPAYFWTQMQPSIPLPDRCQTAAAKPQPKAGQGTWQEQEEDQSQQLTYSGPDLEVVLEEESGWGSVHYKYTT